MFNVKVFGVPTSAYQSIHDFTVQSAVRRLRSNIEEITGIEEQLEQLLTHFDYPLTTMKGIVIPLPLVGSSLRLATLNVSQNLPLWQNMQALPLSLIHQAKQASNTPISVITANLME